MATVENLRLKILDRPQLVIDERVGTGDGSTKVYKLDHVPVLSGSVGVKIDGSTVTEGVDYTLDYDTGKLSFTTAPSQDEIIEAGYEYAAYTDAELQTFLDSSGGNLASAAGEAILILLTDQSRMITWSKGDTRIDFDRLRQDLKDVADRFLAQGRSEACGADIREIDWEEVS